MDNKDLMAANRFTITKLEANAKQAEGYPFHVEWEVKAAYPAQNEYWIWIFQNDEAYSKYSVKAEDCKSDIVLENADRSKVYTLGLSDDKDAYFKEKCVPLELLFDGYTDLECVLMDGRLRFCTSVPDARIAWGSYSISAEDSAISPVLTGRFEMGVKSKLEKIEYENYEKDAVLRLRLRSHLSDVTAGPEIASGLFFMRAPCVKEVQVEIGDEDVTINALFTHGYGDACWASDTIKMCAILWHSGDEVHRSEPTQLPKGEVCELELKLPASSWAGVIENCYLSICLENNKCISIRRADQNYIDLSTPQITSIAKDGDATRIYWQHEAKGPTTYRITCGKNTWETGKKHLSIPPLAMSELDSEFVVRAVTHAAGGPMSKSVRAFEPGYYPIGEPGGIQYCRESYGDSHVCLDMGLGLFEPPLSEMITQGLLTIDVDGKMTVDNTAMLTAKDFDSWLEKLHECGLTVSGHYKMRSALARIASAAHKDTLYYLAGVSSESRSAALIPGLSLCVEGASYSWQSSDTAENNAGFVQGAYRKYMVSLNVGNGGHHLSMDSFFAQLVPGWEPVGVYDSDSIYYAGGVDLFTSRMRQPYWALWAPQHFLPSSEEPTMFPSDNMVVVAAESTAAVRKAIEQLNTNPTKALTVPHMICRGRSFITLEQPIWLNGSKVDLPLGSTLGDALKKVMPLWEPPLGQNTRMQFSRQLLGRYMKVHTQWFDDATLLDMPLLPADRIDIF